MMRTFIDDQSGFVLSSEFLIIATLVVCGTVVGMASIKDSLVLELHDVSEAVGAVSQSYNVVGIQKPRDATHFHGRCSGFGYNDDQDLCDCQGVSFTQVCGKDDPSNSGNAEGT